jgi:hypothetical protein
VNQRESFAKSASLLEGLLGHMVKGAVSRLELRDAINQARESEFALKDSIQAHIRNKRELAELIGIEKLPGSEY